MGLLAHCCCADKTEHEAELVVAHHVHEAVPPLECHRHDEPCDEGRHTEAAQLERHRQNEPCDGGRVTQAQEAAPLECHRHDEPCDGQHKREAKDVATCEFVDEEGRAVKVDFATRLAGMTLELKDQSKVVVRKLAAGGQAERLGVKPGWTLRSVDGAEMTDFRKGLDAFKQAFDRLPEAPAVEQKGPRSQFMSGTLLFLDKAGVTREVAFKAEDPGFAVELKGSPCPSCVKFRVPKVVVKSVRLGGQADLAGVKVGWVLKAVGGVEVTDWEQVLRLLKDFFGHFTA